MPELPPPKPKRDLLTDLLKVFTQEQAEQLLSQFAEIKAQGYGRVTVVFANGHPDVMESTEAEKFEKPKGYKPE